MEFSGKNTGVGCHFLLQENVLLDLKGRPESVLALGLTDPSSSRHHQGPRLFPIKGHCQHPPRATVSFSSNSREKAPSAKLLRRMRTNLTESPQQSLLISHWPLLSHMTPPELHIGKGTAHPQTSQDHPVLLSLLCFLMADQLPVRCVGY